MLSSPHFTYLILSFLFFTSIPIPMSTIFSSLLSDNSSLRPQPKTMVADLSILSLSRKGEANGGQVVNDSAEGSWTWNPNNVQDDDDAWEVKAFAEDTSNIMGATWPPRSYTCTFCRREFRSAQALGGHMNVHRKDRARLNRSQFPNPYHSSMSASSSSSTSPLIIPTNQEFASNGELCVLYQLPQGNGVFTPSRMNARSLDSSSSSFISIQPYTSNAAPYPPNTNLHRQLYPQGNIERSTQWISCEGQGMAHKGKNNRFKSMDFDDSVKEELDLELRLGK